MEEASRHDSGDEDGGLGFSATLQQGRGELAAVIDRLQRFARDGGEKMAEPLFFDSTRACVSTYVEALNRVRQRFWATTFPSSGFWTGRDVAILEANARMMRRLPSGEGRVRRLFLLDQSAEQVISAYREQRTLFDRLGKEAEVRRLDDEFENLKRNILALEADGCRMRVVFDKARFFADLPPEMKWNPQDSELAIYDDFRVDVFGGGRAGTIHSVTSFSRAMRDFARHRAAAEAFFTRLWDAGDDIRRFLERLQESVDSSKSKIHYRANWLARYEFALDEEDVGLKIVEAKRIEEVIRQRGLWGRIGSYLDVGTCTGRYPFLLREAVRENGRIVGIDDDRECIAFAQGTLAKRYPQDERITLVRADFADRELSFAESPFDLVTCMMSTVSHFGRERNERFEDSFQAMLRRMADLLAEGGLLIFTTWSEIACQTGRFLSIYEQQDSERLAAWTPPEEELQRRLSLAGFAMVELSRPDRRLNFWTCERVCAASLHEKHPELIVA